MEKQIPNHIAIIMDGNGRWAKSRFLPRTAGHKAGVEAIREVKEEDFQELLDIKREQQHLEKL